MHYPFVKVQEIPADLHTSAPGSGVTISALAAHMMT